MPSPFLEENTYVLHIHTRTFSGDSGTGQKGLFPVYYSGAAVARARLLYSHFFSFRSITVFVCVSSVRPCFVVDILWLFFSVNIYILLR